MLIRQFHWFGGAAADGVRLLHLVIKVATHQRMSIDRDVVSARFSSRALDHRIAERATISGLIRVLAWQPQYKFRQNMATSQPVMDTRTGHDARIGHDSLEIRNSLNMVLKLAKY